MVMRNRMHVAAGRLAVLSVLAFLFGTAVSKAQVIVLPAEPTPVEKTAATILKDELF